jgi:hypothetical protein
MVESSSIPRAIRLVWGFIKRTKQVINNARYAAREYVSMIPAKVKAMKRQFLGKYLTNKHKPKSKIIPVKFGSKRVPINRFR